MVRSRILVPHPRKSWDFFTIQLFPAFLSHAGSRKERLCLACSRAGTWGPSTRTIRWRLRAPCLFSSPVMSCSESIALIDDADSDRYGVGRRYSHCRRQLARRVLAHEISCRALKAQARFLPYTCSCRIYGGQNWHWDSGFSVYCGPLLPVSFRQCSTLTH
jgi:hypothetical protein